MRPMPVRPGPAACLGRSMVSSRLACLSRHPSADHLVNLHRADQSRAGQMQPGRPGVGQNLPHQSPHRLQSRAFHLSKHPTGAKHPTWAACPLGHQVVPYDILVCRHFEKCARHAGAYERIAVGQPLSAGNVHRVETALVRHRVAPDGSFGAKSRRFLAGIAAILLHGQHDFIDRGVHAVGGAAPIVEDQHVAFAWQPLGDPPGAMLGKQPLVRVGSVAVRPRIAPAIEQIAAHAAPPAAMRGRLGRSRAVIDDPNLAELMDAQHDLVEIGVVGNRVCVHEIGSTARPAKPWPARAGTKSTRAATGGSPAGTGSTCATRRRGTAGAADIPQ